MSKKCKAYSVSKLGLEPADNRKAFYAGWNAALAEQPEQQESEAIHAAWMAGYTEGEREAIEKQTAQEQKPVAWQWKDTMNFRKTPPPNAEPGVWRPVYANENKGG